MSPGVRVMRVASSYRYRMLSVADIDVPRPGTLPKAENIAGNVLKVKMKWKFWSVDILSYKI